MSSPQHSKSRSISNVISRRILITTLGTIKVMLLAITAGGQYLHMVSFMHRVEFSHNWKYYHLKSAMLKYAEFRGTALYKLSQLLLLAILWCYCKLDRQPVYLLVLQT